MKVLEWKGKLEEFLTVFQAELLGLKRVVIRASEENETIKIWIDSLSSLLAIQDSHSPYQLALDIQSLLLRNPNILLRGSKPKLVIRLKSQPFPITQKSIVYQKSPVKYPASLLLCLSLNSYALSTLAKS
ncbi:hypothetical protein HNY73_008092 [Argiope bruennichi]|uniref:Uncharacterized protein n=1 Tax=Argiope bruennichi TaxID=94029 RepID=A0A8T0F684_ARGBR|nr:hypothetical protein HNY73_008092 [Argiope bruennichi]